MELSTVCTESDERINVMGNCFLSKIQYGIRTSNKNEQGILQLTFNDLSQSVHCIDFYMSH